jgi:signal transduction histidine kinase/DNA-binding response OmpR family regulator
MIDRVEDGDTGAAPPDFQFLIERNADGMVVLDEDGTVLFVNPAAEEAFGRSADQLIGKAIGLPVTAGETTEIAILRPGGTQIDAEMRVVSTTWGRRPASLVSLRDISARKAAEEQRRQAQKMEAIGRLTAGVAHDFNNLLTVVMGNLETIKREMKSVETTPRLVRAVGHAMEGAERAATLTHRLLAFSRRQPLEPVCVDVNKLILGMSDLLLRTLGEAVAVETKLCEGALRTQVDPGQLETAILNLAVNARDAMPRGGRLIIETHNCRSGPHDHASEPYVEICMRDSGVGMTPDVLAKVFEPFFTTKGVGQGTGLGLSQVFGFVKQSGGDVRIESAPEEGTTVTLFLPWLASSAAPSAAQEPASPSPPLNRELILVVDDDEAVRAYCVETLRELGYRILEAGDAVSALDVLERHPEAELLFTDLGLPGGMNGRDLATEARRRFPNLRVLLTSGYAGGALISGGRLEPGLQLLSKPYTYSDLAAKIRSVLDGAAARPLHILVVEDEVLVRMTIVEALLDAGCLVEEAETASEAVATFRRIGSELDAAIIDIGLPDGRGDGLISEFRTARVDFPILLSTGYSESDRDAYAAFDRVRILEKPFDGNRLRAALREVGLPMPL